MSTAVNSKTIEDHFLLFVPLITALAGFQWSGIIPGTDGFLTGVFLGAFAKFAIGFAQNPHPKNWEDWLPLLILSLSFTATAFASSPTFLTYGTVLGFAVKALGYFQPGDASNKSQLVEDVFLATGAFIALYGAFAGNTALTNAGILLGIVGKAFPSIGTGSISTQTAAPATAG